MSIYFQTPATIKANGISTKADGTIDVVFNTQEMGAAETAALFSMRAKFGQLAFISQEIALTDTQLDELDIPESSPEFKGDKSPSQRLRAVLYVLWEQDGKRGEFETFYRVRMERIIETIKDKLTWTTKQKTYTPWYFWIVEDLSLEIKTGVCPLAASLKHGSSTNRHQSF